jgi:hypothetical protein
MKEHFDKLITFLKEQDINGCITGSCLLEYFDGADVDVFTYDEAAFTKMIYSLYHNKMFLLLDPMEQWKFKDWTENPHRGSLKKLGLISIKFKYNMLIDVNIIFKEKNHSIFDVLSSFDMDIISVGYDLKTKKTLDLSENNGKKIATWNKWNKSFYNPNIWAVSRILRQFSRVIKYHKRGYNTDDMTRKYIEILEGMIEYENIFSSDKMDEKVANVKTNSKILITILKQWLETHSITDEEVKLIESTIKNL